MLQDTTAEDGNSIAGRRKGDGGHACFGATDLQGDTRSLRLRQVELILLAMIAERGFQSSLTGNDNERAAAHMLGGGCNRLTAAVADSAADGHRLAKLVGGLEGHTVFNASHKAASLGEEGYQQFVLLNGRYALLRTLVHATSVEVAGLLRTAVDGKHAGVESVPNTIIVGSHLAVVEGPRVLLGIAHVADSEIKHPAGIGPYLVIARIK